MAVLGGLWYWLSPATFALVQWPWTIVTGILVVVLVVVEFLKWPLPKYLVVLTSDGADEVLLRTRQVAEARAFLADYVQEHGIDEGNVTDVTYGRRG